MAVFTAVHTSRIYNKGKEALPAQEISSIGGYHPSRMSLTMVSTRCKGMSSALTRKDAATRTEMLWKQTAIQTSGCGECQKLSLVWNGSKVDSSMRRDQVHDLLSVVVELREQVEMLTSIREPKEINGWDQALASLRQERPRVEKQDQESLKTVGQRKGVNGGKFTLGVEGESSSCPCPL